MAFPDRDGVLVSPRLSQADLGRLVGLSRETVNATLQEWREQSLVEMDRRSVRLRHPERLRQIASQPPAAQRHSDSDRPTQG